MIDFDMEVLQSKNIKCSLKRFMERYYVDCALDYHNSDILLIYVNSYIDGNMQYVFEVPMIKGKDLDDKKQVEQIIRKGMRDGE